MFQDGDALNDDDDDDNDKNGNTPCSVQKVSVKKIQTICLAKM